MGSEKFCLKWNDFESNISSAFRDLRTDKELFDVTLACDEDHIPAHKVILSACSNFFRNIFRRSGNSQNMFLYLKGVSAKDMESVLSFMYHGEVSVAQDDLNTFLAVAEDLQVKGLTQNNSNNSNSQETKSRSNYTKDSKTMLSAGHKTEARRHGGQVFQGHGTQQNYSQDDDIQDITPVDIKTEVPGNQVYEAAPIDTGYEGDGTMAAYEEGYDYDPQYTETDYDTSVAPGRSDMVECMECGIQVLKKNFNRHLVSKHSELNPVNCDICNKQFKTEWSLRTHQNNVHKIYRSADKI